MTYCANVDAGQILRKNSLNMANIRLIFAQNLARPHVRSLRPPFSDRLLARIAQESFDRVLILEPIYVCKFSKNPNISSAYKHLMSIFLVHPVLIGSADWHRLQATPPATEETGI